MARLSKELIDKINEIVNKTETKKQPFNLPPIDLLDEYKKDDDLVKEAEKIKKITVESNSEIILSLLKKAGINAILQNVHVGATVTRYEISIPPTVSIKKLLNIKSDFDLHLYARGAVRIIAPIPQTQLIGIEVPNVKSEIVALKSLMQCKSYKNANSDSLICCLGADVKGDAILYDFNRCTNLLMAGVTASGKSITLDCILTSLICKYTPEDLRLILVDPKRVELNVFKGIPHLLFNEILSESNQTFSTFEWLANEMDSRYAKFNEKHVSNIKEYNEQMQSDNGEKLFKLVVVIDEYSDFMGSKNDCQKMVSAIRRIAPKARAAGIFFVFLTQLINFNVIDQTAFRSNFSSRIAFRTISFSESYTVIAESGAESLMGNGDMLYRFSDRNYIDRAQGAYVSTAEVKRVCDYLIENNKCNFYNEVYEEIKSYSLNMEEPRVTPNISVDETLIKEAIVDETLIKEAMRIIISNDLASCSLLQRKMAIGYPKAGKIIDQLEKLGYIGEYNGINKREIFMDKILFKEVFGEDFDT